MKYRVDFQLRKLFEANEAKEKTNSIIVRVFVNMGLNYKYLLLISSTDLLRVYSQHYSQISEII